MDTPVYKDFKASNPDVSAKDYKNKYKEVLFGGPDRYY